MSGADWAGAIEEQEAAGAAGGETANETNLAGDETDFTPLSDSGAAAVAPPSGTVDSNLLAPTMH